jgi:hypothetical protein
MTTRGDDDAPAEARSGRPLGTGASSTWSSFDALPKTPKEKVQKYRLRMQGVEDDWDREAVGDRLTR